MAIGTSLFLIAVGAVLRYAITKSISGIDIQTVGLILLVVGVIGLVLSFLQLALVTSRRRNADNPYPRDRDVY
jgi:Co/Zn/Cd efflux system component